MFIFATVKIIRYIIAFIYMSKATGSIENVFKQVKRGNLAVHLNHWHFYVFECGKTVENVIPVFQYGNPYILTNEHNFATTLSYYICNNYYVS